MSMVFAIFLLLLSIVNARPAVRTIRDDAQWKSLLKKHSEETGLPVIVDFYRCELS